jgi:hypothetical protein
MATLLNQEPTKFGTLILTALLATAISTPADASWWLVKSSDGACLVVDVEPTGRDQSVTKIGKASYSTEAEAMADLKRLCVEPKQAPKPHLKSL